jgi:predicted alpha/beta-hydrolase family hydrolase
MAIVRKIELVMALPNAHEVECQISELEASLFGQRGWQVVEIEMGGSRSRRPARHTYRPVSREQADDYYDRVVAERIARGFVAKA